MRSPVLAILVVLAASVLGAALAYSIPSAVFPEIIFRRAEPERTKPVHGPSG